MDKLKKRQILNKYIKDESYSDALKQLKSTELSSEWCHLAVVVYVALDKNKLAKETIKWAKSNSDIIVWRRCIYEYAKARWKKIWGHEPEGIIVLPGIVTQKEKEGIADILEIMKPVLLHIEGDQSVSNELEAKILFIAINAFWLLGDIEKVRTLASYLGTKQPASIELANLAMMGLIEKDSLSSDFPNRLQEDHPDSFNAKMLSQLLRAKVFGESKNAFKSLNALAPEIKNEDKLRYCQGVFSVAQLLGKTEIDECIKLSKELLGEENSFCQLAEAESLLNSGKVGEAKKIVEENKNEKDPQWLQMSAFIYEGEGEYEKAIDYYEKSTKLMASPEVFAALGRLATQASEKDSKFLVNAINAYKSFLDLKPDNIQARHNLAFALARSGKLQEAKEHFKYLSEHTPDIIYKQNYANCLANTGEPEKGLEIYDEICTNKEVPVEAVIVKAELLKQVRDPFISFDFLNQYREEFWDISSYLQCYMKIASQANQDGYMHEAFLQIKELQSQGKASSKIIQEKSLEDLIEYSQKWNERTRQIHDFCLKGRMPWILADNLLNHPAYTGWAIRTQKLDWVSEEPKTNASYSIYSTNGFHPLISDDGKVYLQRLESVPPDSEVVMDITSLITLHRLNLLDKAKKYFKTIYIPTLYLSELLEDSEELIFHQFSNVKAICEIKKSIDNGAIEVLKDFGVSTQRPFPYVNEHTIPEDDDEHYYRLIDILNSLEKEGLVGKSELESIKKIQLHATGVDSKHSALSINNKLVIELSTLKTICNFGLYDKISKNFKILLSPKSNAEIHSEFSTIEYQKQLQDWNTDLCNILSENDFKKIDIKIESDDKDDLSLAAVKLSIQNNIPLYSDDRVIQVSILNDKTKKVSFSTDLFVNALYNEKYITIKELTNIYLQLINWRYKFLMPPVEVFIYLAEQYEVKPPGTELKIVAMYIQDCMRDPGLFCGPEKMADIPLPIAAKLYMEWFRLVSDFIVKCWTNRKFVDSVSEQYTDWVVLNLLPTFPKYLPDGGFRLASITQRIVLGDALTKLITLEDIDLGNKILVLLKHKLELSDVEYNRVVSETIDAI